MKKKYLFKLFISCFLILSKNDKLLLAQEEPAQEAPTSEAPAQEAPTSEEPAQEAPTSEEPAQQENGAGSKTEANDNKVEKPIEEMTSDEAEKKYWELDQEQMKENSIHNDNAGKYRQLMKEKTSQDPQYKALEDKQAQLLDSKGHLTENADEYNRLTQERLAIQANYVKNDPALIDLSNKFQEDQKRTEERSAIQEKARQKTGLSTLDLDMKKH